MVVAEVARKAYLASIVPVIVNAVLNEHQIVTDIVAFVNKGDFPRSRLGEKQRGRILAGWVSRKMRTMAQFAIKDMDRESLGPSSDHPDSPTIDAHRASVGSFRSSSGAIQPGSSSLRNVEPAPQILEQRELELQQQYQQVQLSNPFPVEMPADERVPEIMDRDRDQTPTKTRQPRPPFQDHGFELPDFDQFGSEGPSRDRTPAPAGSEHYQGTVSMLSQTGPPQLRLPGVDGRESLDDWNLRPGSGGLQGNGNGQQDNDGDWTRDMSGTLRSPAGR